MKLIYYSQPDFTDCDFPLIRAFQQAGISVEYYIELHPYSLRRGLLNITKQHPENGIFRADIYPEIAEYRDYLNMEHVFVVNCTHQSDFHPKTLLLQAKLIRRFAIDDVDIVHVVWPLVRNKLLWSVLHKKLVLTLHDPFPHSGKKTRELEFCRRWSFKVIDRIIILSEQFVDSFASTYQYPKEQIYVSRLGMYDCIRHIQPSLNKSVQPYILFFGYIASYKGVEYLLEAMIEVHEKHPDVRLVVAGGGRYYFDKEKYEKLGYIEFRNYYIDTHELATLLQDCMFMVCPYKDATQSGVVQTAFAMDTPIVATDVGALSKAVEHGITGLVVPPCNAKDLAAAMIYLLAHPINLSSMRKNIQNKWKTSMNWDSIAQDYLRCYRSMIKKVTTD